MSFPGLATGPSWCTQRPAKSEGDWAAATNCWYWAKVTLAVGQPPLGSGQPGVVPTDTAGGKVATVGFSVNVKRPSP